MKDEHFNWTSNTLFIITIYVLLALITPEISFSYEFAIGSIIFIFSMEVVIFILYLCGLGRGNNDSN